MTNITKEQMEFLDAAAIAAMRILNDAMHFSNSEFVSRSFDLAEAMLAERTRRYESVKEVKG